jgi:GR25 family glycosyltransferase involved in LPS biosynthesis
MKLTNILSNLNILFSISIFLFCECRHSIEEENVINQDLIDKNGLIYDVIIIGSGAGGIGAAYALKNSGLNVLLIDKNAQIGGTHINAWVNVLAETVPPVFLDSVINKAITRGYAKYVDANYQNIEPLHEVSYNLTYLPQRYTNGKPDMSMAIVFDIDGLVSIYKEDILGKIDILLNSEFIDVVDYSSNGLVSTIILKSTIGFDKGVVSAKYFIDCTDGQLIRKINNIEGKDFYVGEDSQTQYLSSYGFTEYNSASISNNNYINYPSLIYQLTKGSENLESVQANYINDALIYENPNNILYVNPVSLLQVSGKDVLINGEKKSYDILYSRSKEHWKNLKYGNNPRFQMWDLSTMRFSGTAPMLGIRETYRIACEKMLNENMLYIRINSNNYNPSNSLDKIIAIGTHIIDIHGATNIDVATINSGIQPYGVPFGCIVPKNLKNVLIASRASGMTHIAAASFRLTKNIMCLGYAAGKTIEIANRYNTMDVRNIPVDSLLKEIKILETIQKIESMMQ